MYGGVYVVLGELFGLMVVNLYVGEGCFVVGVDINVMYICFVIFGVVIGVCMFVYFGWSIMVYEIVVIDD